MADGGNGEGNTLLPPSLNVHAQPFTMDNLVAIARNMQKEVRLNDFDVERLESCFRYAEAQFADAKIKDSKAKNNKVMGKLLVQIIEEMSPIRRAPPSSRTPTAS
jgi:hypothetical protein